MSTEQNDMEKINYPIEVTGLHVNAVFKKQNIEEIFIPLLKKWTKMQKDRGKRLLIMLAAPPAAGKSTLSSFLKYLSENTEDVTPISVIGMDGFHHYQDYLLSHNAVRNGKIIPMVKVKGALETFDLPRLTEYVKKVAAGEECEWPEYNRILHDPVEAATIVKGKIVLLEGIYLLLDQEGWRDISDYADDTIMILASEKLLRERLIERKQHTGISRAEAEIFVENSDLYNARIILSSSKKADTILELQKDDSYKLINSPR